MLKIDLTCAGLKNLTTARLWKGGRFFCLWIPRGQTRISQTTKVEDSSWPEFVFVSELMSTRSAAAALFSLSHRSLQLQCVGRSAVATDRQTAYGKHQAVSSRRPATKTHSRLFIRRLSINLTTFVLALYSMMYTIYTNVNHIQYTCKSHV